MIISYNWQIIDNVYITLEELQNLVKSSNSYDQESFNSDSNNMTVKNMNLRKPNFGFLFSYQIEEPKFNIP